MSARPRDHFVYRIWDEDDVLLYVGCTMRPVQRMQAHRRQPWAECVLRVKFYGPYEKYDALDRETAIIAAERPLYALSKRDVGVIAAAATHRRSLPDHITDVLRRVPHRNAVKLLAPVEQSA